MFVTRSVSMAKYHKIGLGGSVTVKKRWQTAVFQLRKSSVITKLELDNDEENLYDGRLLVCLFLVF